MSLMPKMKVPMMRLIILTGLAVCLSGSLCGLAAAQDAAEPETVTVFEAVAVDYDETWLDPFEREGVTVLWKGQIVQKTVKLPPAVANQRDARRIVAAVHVEPVLTEVAGRLRPGDPWTRIASLSVVLGDPAPLPRPEGENEDEEGAKGGGVDVELLRFITGFGGEGTFEQDVTPLAPLLAGEATFRMFISTYMKPGWKVTVTLTYQKEGVGFRRPVFAEPIAHETEVTAETSLIAKKVTIPEGLAQPRLRIISTGHASDGQMGDEFVTRSHVLRVDGEEVARFRPWREEGGPLRPGSPTSGRIVLDGRSLWSSDLDRSGWHPGARVEPLVVPVPELTPGEHEIELEILEIRPLDERGGFGYWRLSAMVVADEPWPE